MIIEQAFFGLPDFLVRNSDKRANEASIVSAFSLSILQELNSRNIQNPIRYIDLEHFYDEGEQKRVDLYVDLVGNKVEDYTYYYFGARNYNWIEVKYYKKQKSNKGDQITNAAKLLNDVFRLVGLVNTCGETQQSDIGRYLLHVYVGDPRRQVILNCATNHEEDNWLNQLITSGRHLFNYDKDVIISSDWKKYSGVIKKHLLEKISIKGCVTNIVIEPLIDIKHYTFILSRIDSIRVQYDKYNWELNSKGIVKSSSTDAFEKIKNVFFQNVKECESEFPNEYFSNNDL